MPKDDFLPRTKEFTYKLFEALLRFAYLEANNRPERAIGCEWIVSGKVIKFTINKQQLQDLYSGRRCDKIFDNQIRPALTYFLPRLGVVKNMEAPGGPGGLRKFELHLWVETENGNLELFDKKWDSKAEEWNSQKAQASSKRSARIDWHTVNKKLLEEHKKRLSTNPLQDITPKSFDDVYVPLGLVERKDKNRPQVHGLDPLPERGSEFYRVETSSIEYDEFLKVVNDRQSGEHIVILGEAGAGKTTLLTRVWQSLSDYATPEAPTIVAWIPLGALGEKSLQEYLETSWLKQVCEDKDKPAYLASLNSLHKAGQVYLLLDGANDMGGDGLKKIDDCLRTSWAKLTKSVVTCRLNLWDGSGLNELKQFFRIFRTLGFEYANYNGEDEVEAFILKWFGNDVEAGKKLRTALYERGARIQDLVRNPLRLTLVCNIWWRDESLPNTQADLYHQVVNYIYKYSQWTEFVKLRTELDRSMGELAKYGINKPQFMFRFTETELRNQSIEVKHIEALKNLCWLNCVGVDEHNDEVYVFFHPTFQEYFAACNIDNWNEFIPEKDFDYNKWDTEECYPVFNKQWQQTILMWVGRNSLKEEKYFFSKREDFIWRLIDFQKHDKSKWHYQAYYLAGCCISEFMIFDRNKAREITEKMIEYWFVNIPSAIEDLDSHTRSKLDLFRWEALHLAPRELIIQELVDRLGSSLESLVKSDIAWFCGNIAIGNDDVISKLFELIENNSKEKDSLFMSLQYRLYWCLGQVTKKDDIILLLSRKIKQKDLNPKKLSQLLQSCDFSDLYRFHVAWAFSNYYKRSNREKIGSELVQLIDKNILSDASLFVIANIMGENSDRDNDRIISTLLRFLDNTDLKPQHYADAAWVLGETVITHEEAIRSLLDILENPSADDLFTYRVTEALVKISKERQDNFIDRKLISASLDQLSRSDIHQVKFRANRLNFQLKSHL